MTLVVILRLSVAPGRESEFERFLAQRAAKHRTDPGFERMYLLRSDDTGEYRIVTWWRRLDDPQAWIRQETYSLSEDRAHAGLIVGPVPHDVLQIVQQF